jgi:hypothetical protein
MKPIIISGELDNSEIKTSECIADITQMISEGQVIIIRGVFVSKLLNSVKKEIFEFGQNSPENNPKRDAKTDNFHRVDNNHPSMSVKRIAHFFRYSYANQNLTSIFELIHPLNILRNSIANLNPEYTFYNDDDGFLSQPAALHYPVGGGYMSAHVDPIDPQKVEMVLSLSQRGVDFNEGGLSIYIDNVWNDVEKFIQFGDICMFRPDIPHRVDPIDAGIELDWNTISGRWTIFSPIANISNEDINETEVKSRF